MSAFSYLLAPATVCLALPLYEQVKVLIQNLSAILAGVLCGTVVSILSVFLLGKLFQLDRTMLVSLLPKSVTTAMGAPVSEALGGVGSITVAAMSFEALLKKAGDAVPADMVKKLNEQLQQIKKS